jgi:hypothetical protein
MTFLEVLRFISLWIRDQEISRRTHQARLDLLRLLFTLKDAHCSGLPCGYHSTDQIVVHYSFVFMMIEVFSECFFAVTLLVGCLVDFSAAKVDFFLNKKKGSIDMRTLTVCSIVCLGCMTDSFVCAYRVLMLVP